MDHLLSIASILATAGSLLVNQAAPVPYTHGSTGYDISFPQCGVAYPAGAFGIVGTVGWMVVLPALAGIALGRYLDTHLNGGIFWTLSLLMLGLTLGCAAAWRHVKEVGKE